VYVRLRKIRNKDEADVMARTFGWEYDSDFQSDHGESLIGYWVDDGEVTSIPAEKLKRGKISPVLCIVHERLFPETLYGWIENEYIAYVTQEEYESMF